MTLLDRGWSQTLRDQVVKERIGGLINGTGGFIGLALNRRKILALVEQNHMPAIYATTAYADEGGLMSYGANDLSCSAEERLWWTKFLKGEKIRRLTRRATDEI
jgi:hypothetical protein